MLKAHPTLEIASIQLEKTKQGQLRIYPLGENGEQRVWRRSYESCLPLVESKRLISSKNGTIYQLIEAGERTAALFSNWVGPRYSAGTFGGQSTQ